MRNTEVQVSSLQSTLSLTLAFYWVQICPWWRKLRYSKTKARGPARGPTWWGYLFTWRPEGLGLPQLCYLATFWGCECFYFLCVFSFMSEFQKGFPCVLLLIFEIFISRYRYDLVKRDIPFKKFRENPLLKMCVILVELSSIGALCLSMENMPTYDTCHSLSHLEKLVDFFSFISWRAGT